MRTLYKLLLTLVTTAVLLSGMLLFVCCNQSNTSKPLSSEGMVTRGKYLVTAGSCNDCHSPKIFTAMGPVPDTTKLLSGSPEGMPLPKIDTAVLRPGYWVMGTPDLTAWAGPWGISYAANLTPDSTTGIGAWTEENFMNSIRKGKHLGLDGGRPILPPMPWPFIAKMTDDDLKSIYAYLKSIPPVKNKVATPVAPPDVMAMSKNVTQK